MEKREKLSSRLGFILNIQWTEVLQEKAYLINFVSITVLSLYRYFCDRNC